MQDMNRIEQLTYDDAQKFCRRTMAMVVSVALSSVNAAEQRCRAPQQQPVIRLAACILFAK